MVDSVVEVDVETKEETIRPMTPEEEERRQLRISNPPLTEPDQIEEIKNRLIAVESSTGTVAKWMNPKTMDSAYPAGIRVEYKGDIYENTSGDLTMEEPSLHPDWTLVP